MPVELRTFWSGISRDRFERRLPLLFAGLVLLIFVYPSVAGVSWGLAIFLSIVLLGVLRAIPADNRRELWVALVLGIVHVVGMGSGESAPRWVLYVGLGAGLVFYAFMAAALLRYVMHGRLVTRGMLYGAASVYLLLGITWALAYALTEAVVPGSFSGASDPIRAFADYHYLYFSFTTLTTLGYGDVVPQLRFARSLVMLEAVTGVFYTTVILARLVGLYATGEAPKDLTRGVHQE